MSHSEKNFRCRLKKVGEYTLLGQGLQLSWNGWLAQHFESGIDHSFKTDAAESVYLGLFRCWFQACLLWATFGQKLIKDVDAFDDTKCICIVPRRFQPPISRSIEVAVAS